MDHGLGTRIRTILAAALMIITAAGGLIVGSPPWAVSHAQQEGPADTGATAANATANATTPTTVETARTANITTTTVYSYITLPPVTRPPSSYEIGGWISGGFVAGLLAGLAAGYAVFARGVAVKKQQTGKASAEKKRR